MFNGSINYLMNKFLIYRYHLIRNYIPVILAHVILLMMILCIYKLLYARS